MKEKWTDCHLMREENIVRVGWRGGAVYVRDICVSPFFCPGVSVAADRNQPVVLNIKLHL